MRSLQTGRRFVEGLAPQRLDGAAVGEAVRPAELVGDLALGRHAEGMEQSGGEVGGGDGPIGGLGSVAVTGAVDLAAANAGAGQRDREDPAPMIAPGLP